MSGKHKFNHINEWEKNRAVTMWVRGQGTLHIAEKLRVPEWYIYNHLPRWRGMDECQAA